MALIEFFYLNDNSEEMACFTIDEDSYKLMCHKFWDPELEKYLIHNAPRRASELNTDAEHGADHGDVVSFMGMGGPWMRLLSKSP